MNTGYYTTNTVKVLLTQEQCKQMLFMCQSISKLCEDYMAYCWKDLLRGRKFDRNKYYKENLKELYREYKGQIDNPFHYARIKTLNNYFTRIEKESSEVYKKRKSYYFDDNVSDIIKRCTNVSRLSGKNISYLTLPACANDLTISKVNKHGTISINGIGKKIPLDSEFKESFLGDDKVTWMVFTIKHKKGSLMTVRLTLICGTQKNPYFDKEGFYQLLEKGKKHGRGK